MSLQRTVLGLAEGRHGVLTLARARARGVGYETLRSLVESGALVREADGVFRAQWVTFDGLTVTGETFDKDGSSWVRFSATGSGDKEAEAAQLNAKLTPWTFAVYPYKANAMKTKLADLVEPPKAS